MPYTALSDLLARGSDLPLTGDQEEAIAALIDYLDDPSPYTVYLLRGYAGTGKTYLLRWITEAAISSGLQVELMASTGRAAKVLAAATGRRAATIHRTIYRASSQMQEEGGTFQLASSSPERRPTLYIVDEASMISGSSGEYSPFGSGNLLDDLLAYVFGSEGSRLLLVGDTAQLPPVGMELSEALDPEVLSGRYGLTVYGAELRQVVRQRQGGILHNATALRDLIDEYSGSEPEDYLPIHLETEDWRGIYPVEPGEFFEDLEEAYQRYGREETLVICPSNRLALECNQAIRGELLYYEEQLVPGERLIVARNNYHYTRLRDHSDFIANGEVIELRRVLRYWHEYELDFADALVYLPDRDEQLEVRLLVSALTDPSPQRSAEQRQELFDRISADYAHISSVVERRRAIRRDKFWGALEVKYAYAVTAHKAQGGQWRCVFVDLSLAGRYLPLDRSMARWIYTALTRATSRVYLLGFVLELVD